MRNCVTGTGGGPVDTKVDPVLDQVCLIIGRGCTGIENVRDCDQEPEDEAVAEAAQKVWAENIQNLEEVETGCSGEVVVEMMVRETGEVDLVQEVRHCFLFFKI